MATSSQCTRKRPPNTRAETTPLQAGKTAADHCQMQIVPAASAARPFELPDGWVLEVRPRGPNASSQTSDKYYYEPHTGRQFRSLVSIKRYLYGEEEPMPQPKASKTHREVALNFETVRRTVHDGKMWRPEELESAQRRKIMVPTTVQHCASSILPDGWIVEDVPRKCGLRSDRYFIEPGTGRKFRSVPEMQRYLTADQQFRPKFKPLKMMYPTTPPQSSHPREKMLSLMREAVNSDNFNVFNPPEKVNWILSSSGEESWSPFVDESRIPDHVKELWQDTFFLGMTGRKQQIPQVLIYSIDCKTQLPETLHFMYD